MKRKPAGKASVLGNYIYMLRIGWKYAPGWIFFTFALETFHRVVIFFEHTYSLKFIIDTITGDGSFSRVAVYIGVIAASVALCLVLQSWLDEYWKPRGRELVHRGLQKELFAQATGLDLSSYDDPAFYNDFIRSVNEAPKRFDDMVERARQVCVATVSAACSIVFIAFLDPAGFIIAAAALPFSILVSFRIGKRQFAQEVDATPHNRKMGYFARVFYLADHAKELRLSAVAAKLAAGHEEANKKAGEVIKKHSWPITVLFFFQYAIPELLLDGTYLSYLSIRAIAWKSIGLGDLVSLLRAMGDVVQSLQDLVIGFPDMQKDALYVQTMRSFQDRKPSIVAPERPEPLPAGPWELELKGVCFSYPGKEGERAEPVLSGVNLIIGNREKVAIVGHNGAGKTTLTKLIMRLYDPTEGKILLNGVDIRSFDPAEYRSLISTVFQDFQIFASTVAENVVLDSLDAGGKSREAIADALGRSGFGEKLSGMELGIDSPLTREFEDSGVNLSGGENQKVALARVFVRDDPAAILDEPSSALDPESEYRFNRDMALAARDRAMVWISHRLSSTRDADRIIHLERGRIIEEGSHEELMARAGQYAAMFAMQAERYRPPVGV